ncbi:MAG TPA: glycosyltransferase [Thermoanaerobaculia bacterium]
MRIVQSLPAHPSEYDKKAARIDFDLLRDVAARVTLTYGQPPVSELPEAVAEEYFDVHASRGRSSPYTIGSFYRRSIVRIVEQTVPRLHRTRDDIEWLLLDHVPTPADFAQFDAWIDPAVDEKDLDGFVAEALVCGKVVVAFRTAINMKRLEKGRTGFLVPPGDANELTHAILAALFKPEVAQQKIEAARQTISKFHPRQRLRALTQLLETTQK